jgi:hypothetical protein
MVQDTSLAALHSLNGREVDRKVLQYAQHFGGVTCDETEVGLDMRHQTASSAIHRLVQAGHLRKSGIRRPTRSNRNAIVWVP